MRNLLLTASAAAALHLASCSKDSNDANVSPVSNPDGQAAIAYQVQVSNPGSGINQRTTAGGQIDWTSGFINPKEIKFEAKTDDSKIEYKSHNTETIDLFAPDPVGFGLLTLPAGTYEKISLKMKLEGDNNSPALLLNGIYSDDVMSVPVRLVVNKDVEIKTEDRNVVITPGTYTALTTLDLSNYTAGLTETMFHNAVLTNGVLVISSTSNTTIYNAIMSVLNEKKHKWEYKKK